MNLFVISSIGPVVSFRNIWVVPFLSLQFLYIIIMSIDWSMGGFWQVIFSVTLWYPLMERFILALNLIRFSFFSAVTSYCIFQHQITVLRALHFPHSFLVPTQSIRLHIRISMLSFRKQQSKWSQVLNVLFQRDPVFRKNNYYETEKNELLHLSLSLHINTCMQMRWPNVNGDNLGFSFNISWYRWNSGSFFARISDLRKVFPCNGHITTVRKSKLL